MAQFYTLEEAARVLGMSPEDLKQKAQHREVRAFMDGGSWQFRVADIDELARRRGPGQRPRAAALGPRPGVPDAQRLATRSTSPSSSSAPPRPTSAGQTGDLAAAAGSGSDDEHDVQFDDLSLPPGPLSGSSSMIIGMKSGGKLPSDSDVRLVPDKPPTKGASDSDVRLAAAGPPHAPERLRRDPGQRRHLAARDSAPSARRRHGRVPPEPGLGSSAEVSAAARPSRSSDFELTPSSVIDAALQPDSGSDFELTALDASDEFEATPLAEPERLRRDRGRPSASGINLARPSDSGINLQGLGGFDLCRPTRSSWPRSTTTSRPGPPPRPSPGRPPRPRSRARAGPQLGHRHARRHPADPGATSMGRPRRTSSRTPTSGGRRPRLRPRRPDRPARAASDFDLEESDTASEVFAIDEDDVDQNAATAMGAALADEDESGEFAGRRGDSGESRPAAGTSRASRRRRGRPRRPAAAGARLVARRARRPSGAGSGSACSASPPSCSCLDVRLDRPGPQPLRVPGRRPGLGPDQVHRRPLRLTRRAASGGRPDRPPEAVPDRRPRRPERSRNVHGRADPGPARPRPCLICRPARPRLRLRAQVEARRRPEARPEPPGRERPAQGRRAHPQGPEPGPDPEGRSTTPGPSGPWRPPTTSTSGASRATRTTASNTRPPSATSSPGGPWSPIPGAD